MAERSDRRQRVYSDGLPRCGAAPCSTHEACSSQIHSYNFTIGEYSGNHTDAGALPPPVVSLRNASLLCGCNWPPCRPRVSIVALPGLPDSNKCETSPIGEPVTPENRVQYSEGPLSITILETGDSVCCAQATVAGHRYCWQSRAVGDALPAGWVACSRWPRRRSILPARLSAMKSHATVATAAA